MQQVLESLQRAATTAAQKGFTNTQQQLEVWHQQLSLISSAQNIIPVTVQLLGKAIAGLQAQLESGSVDDRTLHAQCQTQAATLFHSHNLIQEYAAQRAKLRESNENAQKNPRYFDTKKNEALRAFNTYLAQLLAKNVLSNEELMAFNQRLRETLDKDFGVKNLPRPPVQARTEPKVNAQPRATGASNAPGKIMSGFSKVFDAANSNDPEAMKEASQNFIGFLISMIVECIASVCRIFAPAMSPFISQMANFAKGAFSHWFTTSMDTAANGEEESPEATMQNRTPERATKENATPAPDVPTAGPGIFNALRNFMSSNAGISTSLPPVTPSTPTPSSTLRK